MTITANRENTTNARLQEASQPGSGWTPLLVIEDHFVIPGHGLVLTPDFTLSTCGAWDNFSGTVLIETQHVLHEELRCFFMLVSLSLAGVDSDVPKKKVILLLPDGTKTTVPRGSTVWVPEDVRNKLSATVVASIKPEPAQAPALN